MKLHKLCFMFIKKVLVFVVFIHMKLLKLKQYKLQIMPANMNIHFKCN